MWVTVVNFLECEELGTGQPRHCGTCKSCTCCSVRSQEDENKEDKAALMKEATEKAAEEAAIRKDALYDRMIADWKKAALVKAAAKIAAEREAGEPALIEDTITIETSVETKLMKTGQLMTYDDDKKESEGKLSTQSSVETEPDNKDQKTLPEDAATASEANEKKPP